MALTNAWEERIGLISLAVDRPGPARSGESGGPAQTAPTSSTSTFDKLAATCAEYLTKGREVAVVGKLRLSERTGRDGERRSKIQVAVQFLGAPTKGAKSAPADDHKPEDKPAGGAYRRKAS